MHIHHLGRVARLVERLVIQRLLSFNHTGQVDQTRQVHFVVNLDAEGPLFRRHQLYGQTGL